MQMLTDELVELEVVHWFSGQGSDGSGVRDPGRGVRETAKKPLRSGEGVFVPLTRVFILQSYVNFVTILLMPHQESLLARISLTEELAANALPPAVVQGIDGWRLRYNFGVTRRANSVLASEHGGRYSVEEKLEHTRAFYARWNSRVRFQLNPASQPSGLAEILVEKGYTRDGAVHIQTASVSDVLNKVGEPQHRVRLEPTLNAPWHALYAEIEGADAHKAEVRRAMFSRIPLPAAYVLLELDAQPAAVGLGVLERGHVGVFNMATHPKFRRRGAATAVLRALAGWGRARGAWALYLQVADENAGARPVYERLGFRTLYQYTYLEAP